MRARSERIQLMKISPICLLARQRQPSRHGASCSLERSYRFIVVFHRRLERFPRRLPGWHRNHGIESPYPSAAQLSPTLWMVTRHRATNRVDKRPCISPPPRNISPDYRSPHLESCVARLGRRNHGRGGCFHQYYIHLLWYPTKMHLQTVLKTCLQEAIAHPQYPPGVLQHTRQQPLSGRPDIWRLACDNKAF